ncbi:hypothetical protein AADZ84_11005 [Colwelliaceae bacterium MEBiC 14330]
MTSERIVRIVLGFSMPPLLAGVFLAFIATVHKLLTSHFNFSWMRISEALDTVFGFIPVSIGLMFFALIFYGIQSLLYSLLMEFVVQKMNNDKLVILISMLLGVFVVRFLGLGNILGIGVSTDIANVVTGVGGVVGLIVGYYLRKDFRLELANKPINQDK